MSLMQSASALRTESPQPEGTKPAVLWFTDLSACAYCQSSTVLLPGVAGPEVLRPERANLRLARAASQSRVGERVRSGGLRTVIRGWRASDGALKGAATDATASRRQMLPGSMNLNRPLQIQRQRRRTDSKTTGPRGRRRHQSQLLGVRVAFRKLQSSGPEKFSGPYADALTGCGKSIPTVSSGAEAHCKPSTHCRS